MLYSHTKNNPTKESQTTSTCSYECLYKLELRPSTSFYSEQVRLVVLPAPTIYIWLRSVSVTLYTIGTLTETDHRPLQLIGNNKL